MVPSRLVLSSGDIFPGRAPFSQNTPCFGEVVFNTGMTGYVEVLTDPSYAGQILVFTYPLIGNYGVTSSVTWESPRIHLKGVVVSTLAPYHDHYDATSSLTAWLVENDIPYITDVDTRALTLCLRKTGVMPGAIVPTADANQTLAFEAFDQIDWVQQVSVSEPRWYGTEGPLIIAVDCGVKENSIRCLMRYPVRIKRVPYDYDFTHEPFDGVFLSNGPGDPVHCQKTIKIIQKAAQQKKPMFGICLGTQLMALAFGAKTYKLRFGHRAQNQPCVELTTGRCYLTSQNHSYAVDEKTLSKDWRVIFRNLNDHSVEGIAHGELPFFAVQFHPEASPGPLDTQWLFQVFYRLVCENSLSYAACL